MSKKIVAYILILITFISIPLTCFGATTYTYSFDEDGKPIKTQEAYLPDKTITDLGLLNPEDLYVYKNNLYITDTGNNRVLVFDMESSKVIKSIEHEEFSSPKGVFVNNKGDIYVADSTAKAVFIFDKEYNLKEKIGRPDTPSFADVPFEPLKICADNRGNMYIVGEGVYNGIIQLSSSGEFLGFFTVNKTTISIQQAFKNLFYTKEQLDASPDRVPITFSNITIDSESMVYTTTMGSLENGVKKHNTMGQNIFKSKILNPKSLTDLIIGENGIIYTSNKDGEIFVYSNNGENIFWFGGTKNEADIAGQYSELSSITIDDNMNLWTLDKEKGFIQSFTPTDYTLKVYEAIELFEKGKYEDAYNGWKEVLTHNEMSILAHNGIGKSYLYEQNYNDAKENFMLAGNREYYSEAFWEIRNMWLQKNLPLIFLICIFIFAFYMLVGKLDKNKILKNKVGKISDFLYSRKVLGKVLYFTKVPFHPLNCFYDIKVRKKANILSSSIIYFIVFVVFLFYQTSKGFIFQTQNIENIDLSAVVVGIFAISSLYIICNYLMTAINDGEGNLKEVFIYPAYSSFPFLMAMIINLALSYVLTVNEMFFYNLTINVGACWSIILLLIGIQEIHGYNIRTSIKSIIYTFGFMLIIIIMLLIVIVMWNQLSQFLLAIVKELIRNVTS